MMRQISNINQVISLSMSDFHPLRIHWNF